MSLISLVYVSFESHPMSDQEIRDILVVSRENNRKLHITGMLLYRDGFFIQALEGDKEAVEELYDHIKADSRHENVTLVYKNDIQTRSFPRWSMGFNKIEQVDESQLPGFNNFLQEPEDMEYFTENPGRAANLLEAFKNQTYF